MNRKQFRDSNHEIPTKNGRYQWDSPFGRVPVRWINGVWFSISGDRLGTAVRWWR